MSHADVNGFGDHAVQNLRIVTAAACIETTKGTIIGIFHQYAHLGTGKTIHSTNQMRRFGLSICDLPRLMEVNSCIYHPDGCIIPLKIRNGLPHMDMWKPT